MAKLLISTQIFEQMLIKSIAKLRHTLWQHSVAVERNPISINLSSVSKGIQENAVLGD